MLAGVAVWLSGSAQQPRNALKQPLAPSIVAQLDPQQAPASWEGGEQRCFQDVYFCGQKIELARGAPREHEAVWSEAERTAALAKAVPIEPFSYGQAVVQHETQQLRLGQAAEPLLGAREAPEGTCVKASNTPHFLRATNTLHATEPGWQGEWWRSNAGAQGS